MFKSDKLVTRREKTVDSLTPAVIISHNYMKMTLPKNLGKNLGKNIEKLLNNDTQTKIIGLLTILIALWLLLYFIPELLSSLFTTLLGNLILILTIILVFAYNKTYGLGLGLAVIIIYRFAHLIPTHEGFTWTKESTQDFLKTQTTINRNTIFDVNLIKENQASQEELDYFNKHKMWPWSETTIELYKEAVGSNPYIRTLPEDEVKRIRTIYNEAVILNILSQQTKEGQLLLNGVLVKDPKGNPLEELPSGFGEFPYSSGLIEDRTYDVIRCNIKSPTDASLERIKYAGKGGIFGEQITEETPVDYNELEKIIPGFNFIDKPCNPCSALNAKPDYSCKFTLNAKDKSPFISNVWKYLWSR